MSPARVDVSLRPGVPDLLSTDECANALVAAIDAGGAPADATISLTLSDDAELAALNETHMGKAGSTDVLSFPLLPPSSFPAHPGQDPALRAAAPDFPLPPGAAVHLGDIIVSVERAVAQAESGAGGQTSDVAWAPADELRLLITHGALHICGWDHAEPAEEAAMRTLEHQLLRGAPSSEDPSTG